MIKEKSNGICTTTFIKKHRTKATKSKIINCFSLVYFLIISYFSFKFLTKITKATTPTNESMLKLTKN